MEYTNTINGVNIIEDFSPTNNLIIVKYLDFVYNYTSKNVDMSQVKNDSSEIAVVQVLKTNENSELKVGEKLLIDVVMLSQFYYIFEKHPNIDPDIMIAPETLFLIKVED